MKIFNLSLRVIYICELFECNEIILCRCRCRLGLSLFQIKVDI